MDGQFCTTCTKLNLGLQLLLWSNTEIIDFFAFPKHVASFRFPLALTWTHSFLAFSGLILLSIWFIQRTINI